MLRIIDLRVEDQTRPFALGAKEPRFGWAMESDRRAAHQLAYRIRVTKGEDCVWDTEQVEDDASLGILYAGAALEPLTEYAVELEVWDDGGEYARANTRFTTSRFDLPWNGFWVEPEQEPTVSNITEFDFRTMLAPETGEKDFSGFQPAQYLRMTFPSKTGLKRALAFATAHGVYRLYVNGERPDAREFAPEPTSYETFLQYQTYDITNYVYPGENAIGSIVADGWWAGRIGLPGVGAQYGDKTAFFIEILLEYADGSTQIVTPEGMKSTTGPIIYSDIFVGEKYDARREFYGWASAGFNDSAWKPVKRLDIPLDNLTAQIGSPVMQECELPAKEIIITPKGDTVVDFGQVMAGRVRFTVDAPEGVEICLEHCEVLDAEGEFLRNIMGRNKDQNDFYITREGKQTYEPMFTYHGFRYVRVTGWPGEIKKEMFTAAVLTSAMETTGSFACSDERLNRLQKNIVWSQISNTLAIPTDCPQRERAGWTGDLSIFAPTMAFNRDCKTFLERWLKDCREAQLPDGQIPTVVPYWPANRQLGVIQGGHSSSGWGDAIITVPWAMYNAYGDKSVLADNYEAMQKWIDYVQKCAEEGLPAGHENFDEERLARQKYLWNTGFHFGDWLIPSLSREGKNPFVGAMKTGPIVASAYYAYSTFLMGQIALQLDDLKGYQKYARLNQQVTEAFMAEYVPENGIMEADYQGVYVLCLAFDLAMDETREMMTAHLAGMIERNNGCLDTGFLSVPFLMDVLVRERRRDVAMQLLFNTNCPSWLYEVEKGATTVWETWTAVRPDGAVEPMSFNHYAFGCVGDWIYREIAGLNASMPGYKRIRFTPGVDSGLDWAEASHKTPYGETSIRWEKAENGWKMRIVVPANTEADIFFPSEDYTRSGKRVTAEDGVLAIGMSAISVGSGEYEFEFR